MAISSINNTLFTALSALNGQTLSGLSAVDGQTILSEPTGTPFILTQTLGTLRNDFTGCVGFRFTASSAFTITALGRWKVSGNSGMHTLALVVEAGGGVGTRLQSATIDMAAGAAGMYHYVAITPQLITIAGNYYVLSEELNTGDQWYNEDTTVDSVTGGLGTVSGTVNTTNGGCATGSGFNINAPLGITYVPTNFLV